MPIHWTRWLVRLQDTANVLVADGEQRRRVLLSKGARLHAGFVERCDHCSLAVLDRAGMVVSWYDGALGAGCSDDAVLHRHVSQFYVVGDIAAGEPRGSLRFAAAHGFDTQHGWRRRPGGAVYWGTTVLETIGDGNGHVLGFAHITRRSQGPWEIGRVTARRQRRHTRVRLRWSTGGMEPGLVAI
jgi:hypothetical protein